MAGHFASADVGRLLKEANLVVNRSGTQTLLRIAEGCRGRTQTALYVPRPEGGGPGLARQVDESLRVAQDRWTIASTAVQQGLRRLGFPCQVFEFWRARQELNPRPPGS
jgi:hypothetical protein